MSFSENLKEVFIVTNHRFHSQFSSWVNNYTSSLKIKVLDDGTLNNDDRLGAVRDLYFVLQQEAINDDVLIIAGDNLFEFSLSDLIALSLKKKKSVIAFHNLKDKEKVKGKYGVGILEGTKIVRFEEKPQQPQSSLAATVCYLLLKQDLPLIERALKEGKPDNPGDFVKYLIRYSQVHGFVFTESWFDVGSFESLREAEEVYKL